jgi:polyhydroxyalkanoate synthesis regulator phasin
MASTTGKKTKRSPKAERSADRADKSVEAFRDALERSITLPRERIQEVVDDAVKRGRMTRDDANDMVSKLVSRGRKQSEEMVKELEALLEQARKQVERRTTRARKQTKGTAGKVAKRARDAADEPLAQMDKVRRKAGVGPSFPITGYDELTAAQINRRLGDLSKPDLRKIRTYENNNKARKSVVAKIDKALG